MKIKTFILTFLMMMSCSILFGQELLTGEAKTESKLKQFLFNEDYGTITIGDDFSVSSTIEIPKGRKITIDLNGHKLTTNADIYIFKNFGRLTITDNSTDGKGTISSLGIYNGKPQTRTNTDDIDYTAQLTIKGGVFENISPDGGAAIYNHLGVIDIQGGEFYGEYSAITNFGLATIANAYIECLNRDNDAAAIINDFEIEYGENVNVVGRYYTADSETASITDGEATYLFAELNGVKYPSLQAALDACTTGNNTINLLFHNSDNATVSQKEGVNITIVGNGYKNKQFEYTGTIYVNGNSRSTGTETLTIQDVNFVTTDNEHDFISCNSGSDPVIRYAHNVTVQYCNFTAKEESTAVVALRFRQSYNINVVGGTFTNLHSVMWATGGSKITVDGINAIACKEGGISAGTSTPVSVKNSTIEGAKYGVRADGSGAYSLTVENSTLSAEVPVIVRNTTGEYNLTVKEDATLASTNNGPQVVVTAGKDDEAYVTPTSDVNVTLDNVTSTFGLTAKIGNAFYATLQDAINSATNGETVTLIADNCKEDVTVNQAPNYAITIDGAEKTFKGTITVDGKSARYETTGLTIKNVNFDATEGINYAACINLGVSGNSNTRYTNNVTVDNCTFVANISDEVPAVKSYTGGDWNLKINNCTVNEGMHSLAQVTNVEKGLEITGCEVYSKNGINLNNSGSTDVIKIENNIVDVKGYAVRIGVNGTPGTNAQDVVLANNTLKSACDDGDAVIMFRGTATKANFSMTQNVVSGATHISGNTAATKIAADENYWDGKEAPVVAEGSAPIVVNSYYSDDALTNLVRNEMGSIYAFVSSDRIFGDVTTNAEESIKIEIIGKDGNVIGTSSLENLSYATGFNKQLTWRINLGDDDSDSWAMTWNGGAPSINNMPAKVKLYVDAKEGDAAVAEAEIRYTANGDGQSPVFAAKTNAEGKINSFIACTGEFNLSNANTFLKEALTAGDNVAITVAGTYAVPTGKDLTITGAVDGVVFDNIGATNMGGASVTFNNVTFDYYPNVNYTGLQHSGNLVYNNCTFEGQPFLYGTSETFNNCTFNQNSSDAYNVWTYGAKEVAFNECTFNSAGKSVLIYSEQTDLVNNVTVTDCDFIASAPVEGKAAIEMNSELTAGINLTIDAATTANGFGSGNVSGNSLWNNKMGNNNDANNDITVVVDGETVLEPIYVAKIGEEGHRTLQEAINKVEDGETITLLADCDEEVTFTQTKDVSFVLDGNDKTYTGSINITARAGKDAPSTLVIKNFNFKTDKTSHDFIKSVEKNYYPNNITITGCSFEGTSDINTEGYAVVAVRLRSANNIKIEDCTGTGLHSFLQNTAGWNLTIDNVNVNNAAEGGLALGTVQGVTVTNCAFNSGRYGIRLDGQYNNNAVIADNTIEAFIPVVVRYASVDGTITFDGTNEFNQSNDDGYWCVIGTSEYKENGELPTAATAKVSVTLTDETLDPAGIYGNFGVASINRDDKVMKYLSLAEALDAALDGETVNLHWTTGDAAISMAGTVCGKTVTITGTANVDWSKGWFYVGRNGAADGKVIFDNANLTSVSNSSAYGINVSGRKKGSTDTYNGTVEFKNSTVVLDYLIQKNVMTLDNSTLTVKNGCSLTGRLANETENGELATSTTTLNNGSKLVVIGQNGMNLGYEGYGVLNIDATSTFEATQNYGVAANGTMNIAGRASVAGTMTNSGAINLTDINATLTATAGLTVNTDVADYKVAYIEGVYKLVEKDYIAQVGDKKFELFTEALDAVENEGTITLLGEAFDESGKEIDFTKAITFTITGQAPEAKLPIITFQNAIVNIKDANFQIPELDARQNATINVINSTIVDAGGNSIVKSYFNGAINIDETSTVYAMQVTTMGYITVAGTLNATWQTNVYGNGLITLNKGATFNTAALHLTAQDYSGRDNTDAERVGKPAEIIVDGANLTVGKVLSAGGSDYSYNSSKGINVGTIEGKSAILNIKNGANVNIYMANGETTNFGTGATVNVDASTLNTICRAENGTATLANAGTVNVSGTSKLLAAKVTGNGWFYMNGVTLDADTKLLGAKVRFASGTNNIDGSTIDDGFFQVGIGAYNGTDANVDTENGVVVNVKNAHIGANDDTYAGWAGTGFYGTDDEKAEVMTAAKYVLNIENSIAEFGYLHISNDGELNVKGNATEKVWYNNSDYSFYAGDFIINGTATFDATDVLALYTKVSCDNGTDNPGTLNIVNGTEYEAERHNGTAAGTNFTLYKTAVVNADANLHVGEYASIAADAKLNIGGTATILGTVTNNGTINFTSETATLTTPTTGLTVNNETGNNDIKVVYENETYKFIDKDYVAEIVGGAKYETLAEAFDAAQDGDEIVVLKEIDLTAGVTVADDKVVVLDLNGKTISMQDASGKAAYAIKNNGNLTIKDSAKDGKITFKSTTPDNNNFSYATSTIGNGGNLTIENGKIENTTDGGASYAIDGIWHTGEASLTINDGTIVAKKIAVRQVPFSATAKNTVTINGGTFTGETAGLQMFNINDDAKLSETIIKGGTFNGTYAFYTSFTSAQASELAIINIDGGTFNGYVYLFNAQNGSADYPMTVAITDGLFNNGVYIYTKDANGDEVSIKAISGGIFSFDPSDYCAENYGAFPYDETLWIVREKSGEQTFELTAGWNWVSSYITEFNDNGLAMLQQGLGTNGIQIKNNLKSSTYSNQTGKWNGSLTTTSVKEMYKVKVGELEEGMEYLQFNFEGSYVNYDECEIILYPGWNYIGYPVNVETNVADALVLLSADGQEEFNGPSVGDVLKSQQGAAIYFGIDNMPWMFDNQFNLIPGEGYMYHNTSGAVKILRYTTKNSSATTATNNRSSKYWTVDATQYSSNMTMIAMTDVEGGNYEVAAFVNGEVRGSSRPVYVESLDAYILILTISGDDVEEMTFRYYDITTGEEVEFSNRMNYSSDAVVGSIAEPYMLTRGTTGIGEAEMSQVNIYPNPTTTGTEINLQATCDKVEVFNALGAKVAEYQNVDSIDALETAGIYVIRITNDSNVQNCKLVVR